MNAKKILALILVCVISFVTVACSSSSANVDSGNEEISSDAANTSDDAATSSGGNLDVVWIKQPLAKPIAEMKVVMDVQDISGFTFNITEVAAEGSAEKINLLIASGDLPDVFMQGTGISEVTRYKDQNIFQPITDFINDEDMPNLNAILNENPEYKAAMVDLDGEIWGWPYIEEMYGLVSNQGILSINQEWCENVGVDLPETEEDFKEMLIAFRDGDANGNGDPNDEVPFLFMIGTSTFTNSWRNNTSIGQFFGMWGQADTGNRLAVVDGEIICTATTDAYKEGLSYFADLWAEGLIDLEMPLNDFASYQAKLNTPDTTIGAVMTFAIADMVAADRRDEYTTIPYMTGPGGEFGVKDNISEMHEVISGTITTACEDPAAVANMVDLFFEPERSVESNWGALDEYYVKDENGVMVWVDTLPDGFDTYSQFRQYCTPTRPAIVLQSYYDTVVEYPQDAQDLYDDMTACGFVDKHLTDPIIPPNMWYTQEDQDELSLITAQIYNIIDNYNAVAITDGNVDDTWDQYIADLEAAGLPRMLEIIQGSYDSYALTLDTFITGVN